MSYSERIFNEARAMLSQKRAEVQIEYEDRHRRLRAEFPELALLCDELASTGTKLSQLILKKPDNPDEAIGEIMRGNLEVRARIEEILTENGYASDYLTFRYYCKECKDTGYSGDGICGCVKKVMCELNCAEITRSSSLSLCSFSTFELDYYPDTPDKDGLIPREVMTNILDFCCDYADNFDHGSTGLFFMGQTGLGKTHLSLSIANVVMNRGFSVAYTTANELVHKMNEEYFGRVKPDGSMEGLYDADLVILDDLGAEFDTKFSVSVIHELINTRMNRGLATIINTNLSTGELMEAYNDRIVSRILGCYRIIKLLGKDIRQLKSSLH